MPDSKRFASPAEVFAPRPAADPIPDDLFGDIQTGIQAARQNMVVLSAGGPGGRSEVVLEVPYTPRMRRATALERVEVQNRLMQAGWLPPSWDDGAGKMVLSQ